MTLSDYLPILWESAWVASIVPLAHEPTFFAMHSFGGHNMTLAAAMAIVGATAGQVFNWWVGRRILRLKEQGKFQVSEYWYSKLGGIFNRYLFFLLFFSWATLCNFLVVAAGFFNLRLRLALPVIVAGQVFHYGSYLF